MTEDIEKLEKEEIADAGDKFYVSRGNQYGSNSDWLPGRYTLADARSMVKDLEADDLQGTIWYTDQDGIEQTLDSRLY